MIQRLEKIIVPRELFEDKRLGILPKYLYVILAFERGKQIDTRHLVKECDRSPQTIKLYLRILERTGWVTKKGKGYEVHIQSKFPAK